MEKTGLWLRYDDTKKETCKAFPIGNHQLEEGSFKVQERRLQETEGYRCEAEWTAQTDISNCSIGLEFAIENWNPEDYILVPAAVYDGNRFRVLKISYPPMFRPEQYEKHPEVTITDIPHLSQNGDDYISLRAGGIYI